MTVKQTPLLILCSLGLLSLASCASDKKTDAAAPAAASAQAKADSPRGGTSVSMKPGEAGGVIEDTVTASAVVTALDKTNRRVTLRGSDGTEASFTAPAEVRNFDQIKVGDRVNAIIKERLTVYVSPGGAAPSAAYMEAEARAPKGAKPGAMVGESYELIAKIKSIDTAKRVATLQFAGGETRSVQVRDDVDLSRYKVGDNVVIRATSQLTILVESK